MVLVVGLVVWYVVFESAGTMVVEVVVAHKIFAHAP